MLRKLNVAGAENGQMFVTVDEVASAERREMEAMYPVLGEMEPKSADDNFKAFIQNIFEKKVVSSVFLTGEGLRKTGIRILCACSVMGDVHLSAITYTAKAPAIHL